MTGRSPAPPGAPELRLAAGLQAGDPEALAALHATYGRTVFGFLRGALPDRGAAEDVFQVVMTEVWRRGPSYDPGRAGLLTWVMTIARSRAIDELRRRVPEPDEDAVAGLAATADPAASADVLAERWRVAHLLTLLPPDEAEALRLRFYDELSQTEIAERTGIPLGTVKTRMVRGLERLRDLLEAEDARTEGAIARAGGTPAASHPEVVA
jgi:RNA polymerase sigma-70 factor (ECF subfamily)